MINYDLDFKKNIRHALQLELPYQGRSHQRFRVELQSASVLVLFGVNERDQIHLLFVKRADHISVHQGQMAFPGGRVEGSDQGDPTTTALRETEEEVGISPHQVEILGKLPLLHTVTGFEVEPVVGILRARLESVNLSIDLQELAEAIWIPLEELLDPSSYHEEVFRREDQDVLISIYSVRGYRIWGATGAMTKNLLDRYCKRRSE
jgi:8-oxo-dGTP pyrophosphatase MutT (NUDIX family)